MLHCRVFRGFPLHSLPCDHAKIQVTRLHLCDPFCVSRVLDSSFCVRVNVNHNLPLLFGIWRNVLSIDVFDVLPQLNSFSFLHLSVTSCCTCNSSGGCLCLPPRDAMGVPLQPLLCSFPSSWLCIFLFPNPRTLLPPRNSPPACPVACSLTPALRNVRC